jgi:probable rRNA maturation factor
MTREGAFWSLLFVLIGCSVGDRLQSGIMERTALSSMVILKKPISGVTQHGMELFLRRAKLAVRLRGEVNVLITGNSDLQTLNRRFRGKDKPTDVLSFPASLQQEKFAGDIAISAAIASKNARLLRHSIANEIKVLVLHGLLHLAGYDHERDNGAMARREATLREKLRLPVSLIERNSVASVKVAGRVKPRPRAKTARSRA